MFAKFAGVILILATIAAGIYVDLVFFLVNGITEIIHGFEAHPVSGGQVGWGFVHVLFSGVGVLVAFGLCFLWAALFFGWERSSRRSTRSRPAARPFARF